MQIITTYFFFILFRNIYRQWWCNKIFLFNNKIQNLLAPNILYSRWKWFFIHRLCTFSYTYKRVSKVSNHEKNYKVSNSGNSKISWVSRGVSNKPSFIQHETNFRFFLRFRSIVSEFQREKRGYLFEIEILSSFSFQTSF